MKSPLQLNSPRGSSMKALDKEVPFSLFEQTDGGIQDDSSFPSNEKTITCSRDEKQEHVLDGLTQVKNDERVVNVTFDDLVMSNHQCLFPLVKALAATSGRAWESFRFVDVVDMASFPTWQDLRDEMVHDYEETAHDLGGSSDFINVLTWQANVKIPRGTAMTDIVEFLQSVKEDDEVYHVGFGGALGDILDILIPEVLCKLINRQTLTLNEDFVVEVASGWLWEEADWLELVYDCVRNLSELSTPRTASEHNGKHASGEESTVSIRSYSGTMDDPTIKAGFNRSINFNDSKSLAGNLSFKSIATSCAGYASFYDDSFFGTSIDNLGFEDSFNGSKATLSPQLSPRRSPKKRLHKLSPRTSRAALAGIYDISQHDFDSTCSVNDSTTAQASEAPKMPKAA
eukprot:Sro259_g101250.1 n/a (400) ;mRNA; r:11443-12730